MIEINTKELTAVSTQELLRRLEQSDGVNKTYRMIVAELNRRGVPASVPNQD